MNERFTDRARRSIQLASQEAMRLRHDHIGTEHLLLGIVKEGSGLAAEVLGAFNVSLGAVRQKVEEVVHGPNPGSFSGRLRQTERYARVINYAIEEAQSLSNNYVGTEHLLLGILREPEGTSARVLASLNLNLEDVRAKALSLLGKSPQTTDHLLELAIRDLSTRLADEVISPEQMRAIAEAVIKAGWRPTRGHPGAS